MRALRVTEYGEPLEQLRLVPDATVPTPGPGEVAVQVEACALNFADDLLCRGTYQETPPLPLTPGLEMAGTVVEAGPQSSFGVGDRVVGSPSLPFGAFAERCLARDADVFPLDETLPAVDAAAMHVAYQTGWFALHRRAHLAAGETLLVHAGAGGVGSAAIQLGRAAGAHVVATAGGAEKVALCQRLGAEVALDHRSDDIIAAVNGLTEGRGADVIFDPVGGDTFLASTRCIAWEGRIVVIGAASGRYAEARTNHLLVKNYTLLGLNWGGYRTRRPDLVRVAHDALADLHRRGAIAALISRVIHLEGVPEALAELTSSRTTGKVVVEP